MLLGHHVRCLQCPFVNDSSCNRRPCANSPVQGYDQRLSKLQAESAAWPTESVGCLVLGGFDRCSWTESSRKRRSKQDTPKEPHVHILPKTEVMLVDDERENLQSASKFALRYCSLETQSGSPSLNKRSLPMTLGQFFMEHSCCTGGVTRHHQTFCVSCASIITLEPATRNCCCPALQLSLFAECCQVAAAILQFSLVNGGREQNT